MPVIPSRPVADARPGTRRDPASRSASAHRRQSHPTRFRYDGAMNVRRLLPSLAGLIAIGALAAACSTPGRDGRLDLRPDHRPGRVARLRAWRRPPLPPRPRRRVRLRPSSRARPRRPSRAPALPPDRPSRPPNPKTPRRRSRARRPSRRPPDLGGPDDGPRDLHPVSTSAPQSSGSMRGNRDPRGPDLDKESPRMSRIFAVFLLLVVLAVGGSAIAATAYQAGLTTAVAQVAGRRRHRRRTRRRPRLRLGLGLSRLRDPRLLRDAVLHLPGVRPPPRDLLGRPRPRRLGSRRPGLPRLGPGRQPLARPSPRHLRDLAPRGPRLR